MAEWLLAPFEFPFMQQAFAMGVLLSLPAALLSCLLVLRGWALMGDAISHAVLPGVVLAYILGVPLVAGAFAAAMVCALGNGYIADNCRVKQDSVMGVVFSGMFGAGIVLFSMIETDLHLDHILFGDLLGVSWRDVLNTGFIALLTAVIVICKRRDLLVFSFDPQHARAVGLPVQVLHYGCLLYTSPSPRDLSTSRMPSSA